MPRFRLTVEYDGTPYAGWQRQAEHPSIQGGIEAAVEKFCGETVTIQGAGRTDAGVHALAQVAHVDLSRDWPGDTVRDALNAHLRNGGERISIIAALAVADDFDARFSAIRRHYVYRILNRRAPAALDAERVWWLPRPLDVEAMAKAAERLIGRHDFTTFRSTQCQATSPVRTLERLDIRNGENAGEIEIHASARSFLHNQIRSIAGSLRLAGEGKWSPDDMSAALEARDRSACGPVAPPGGLYFASVDYPADREAGEKE